MIAALSALAALGVASLVLRAGLAIFFLTLPPSFAAVARVLPLGIDHRVFLFTAIVAALTTIVFAGLPALQATRLTLMTALRGELHSGVRGARLRNAFVISQVAVSLILMYPMMVASWIGLLLSGIALALSVSGLYGVVTYGLSQRVKEIGIRMALGATPSGIVRLVMRQSGRLVAIGAALGLILSSSVLGVLAAVVPLGNVSILPGSIRRMR